jgi:hypothetical protein
MSLGRTLMIAGAFLFGVGVLIALGPRLPLKLGRLPGDILIRGKHTTFYFPLATCLLLSLVFTLVMWLLNRRWR